MKIGIDTGFGHTKYALYADGKLKLGKFPSVVANANDDFNDRSDHVRIFENQLYYVSDIALKQDPKDIKELISYKTLERFAPLLIAEVLRLENLNSQEVSSVGLGLSPAHKEHAATFKKRISSFAVDEKEYKFKNISITPQGVGAVHAIKKFWENGGVEEPNDYITVDIGFNTMDVIITYDKQIQKGKINEDNSFEQKGIIQIAELMQKYIKNEFQKEITLKEALVIFLGESYKLRGQNHNLSEVVKTMKAQYTIKTMEFLEQKYSNDFDKMDAICFVGGGGYFIDGQYAQHIQTFKDSEYYNAIGNLLMLK
ncbi:hypothetical protein BKH46_08410 [Helicobacter sp. 12S02634-8]|uniref:ParM/StbA family protein n=1 Tax=Helicobacter sp. 12S02634-8 TaxID=1476199 RepID=UPI000BA64C1E|nr:ParM/StbA family protein [Helicobacter sp. 12S02634-8]PAF46252.1 hypothetical protein BKH46_08410 [Helicobacter sp. 12S02634-8]